jgi:uncharacterized membrane protein
VHSKALFKLNHLARALAWCTAFVYIAIETKYALEAQALLNITSFAVLFLLASMQFSISRFLQRSKRQALAESTFHSGLAMFYAALFDLFDACVDEFIRRFESTLLSSTYTYFLYLISWSITILATVLAVLSIDKFLRTLSKISFKETELSNPNKVNIKPKLWPIGSGEARRRRLKS